MVYRKFITKRGKVFGPYYYRSYRDGNSVKKIYIGGEKAYKAYLKKQKSSKVKKDSYFRKKKVEQPVKPLRSLKKRNKIARGLFLLLFFSFIILTLIFILSDYKIPIGEEDYYSIISPRDIPTSRILGLVSSEIPGEEIKQEFDKNIDLIIKDPVELNSKSE